MSWKPPAAHPRDPGAVVQIVVRKFPVNGACIPPMPDSVLLLQPERGEHLAGTERAIRNISDILATLGIPVMHGEHVSHPRSPRCKDTYIIGNEPSLENDIDMFFCHTFLCGGGKLFRDTNTVCTHAINAGCPLDWYVHRCGSCKSPLAARREWSRAKQLKRWIRRGTFEIGVASDWMAHYLEQEGARPQRIMRLPLAWDKDRAHHAPWPQRSQVAYIGRLSYQKGVQLLPAVARLIPDIGVDVYGSGYLEESLHRRCAELGTANALRIHGPLSFDAVAHQLHRTAVLLAPSLCPEPYGLSLSEARCAGAWVIATSRGAFPEWAARDPGVRLVDYSRPDLVTRTIRACMHTPAPVPPNYNELSLSAWQAWWSRT